MKLIVRILLLSLLFQSFQCDENKETMSPITSENLNNKKEEIITYINSFSCTSDSACEYIAFGAKPCGGPWEFLVYPNTINQTTLETMVNNYYEMNLQFNSQTNAISDCMVVAPPTSIDCVGGVCTIID